MSAATTTPEVLTPEQAQAQFVAKIKALPAGRKELYQIIWWSRETGQCSTTDRLRAMLISLYGGQVKVNLGDVQYFDRTRRAWLCAVITHLGHSFYDGEIREACRACGMFHWFRMGFPKASRPD